MSYIGKIPATGNFVKLDDISVVNGQASYTMQSGSVNFTPESANHMLVSLNGVIQAPQTSFSVSGSTITFASALSTGDVINFIMIYGNILDIGSVSDDTISTAKLQNTSVTAGKLATDSVVEAKIQNDAVTRDKINAISTSSAPSFEAKGDGSSVEGKIQLNCHVNSHGVVLQSPPHSSGQSYTIKLPDNQIAVDKFIKVKSITGSGSTAVGQTEFADAGGGVVQTKFYLLDATLTANNTSFADLGSFSISITPTSASNKILLSVFFGSCNGGTSGGNNNTTGFRYTRDGTAIGIGDVSGTSKIGASFRADRQSDASHGSPVSHAFIDSPNTTSAVTYKIQNRNETGILYINRAAGQTDSSNIINANFTSIFIAQEIVAS